MFRRWASIRRYGQSDYGLEQSLSGGHKPVPAPSSAVSSAFLSFPSDTPN